MKKQIDIKEELKRSCISNRTISKEVFKLVALKAKWYPQREKQ